MTTTFTINPAVLEAMLAFTSSNRAFNAHAILWDVLCEVTPESVRLVATDTHVLGLLHLTPIHGYGLDITCSEPVSLVLPLEGFRPLLREKKISVIVDIVGEQVTIRTATGLSLTLPGQSAEEFPQYQRVLALDTPITPTIRTAFDGALLAKFASFAKTMGVPPHLDLGFHGTVSPTSVRIAGLASFYGVAMPRQLAYEEPIPSWLLPPPDVLPERIIRLHDMDGGTGTDDAGCVWTQFLVDELAEQEPGTCALCSATLHSGWMNLDNGGEEVCSDHVQLPEDASGQFSPSVDAMPVAIPA